MLASLELQHSTFDRVKPLEISNKMTEHGGDGVDGTVRSEY